VRDFIEVDPSRPCLKVFWPFLFPYTFTAKLYPFIERKRFQEKNNDTNGH
jgi:hypothetical protein